MNNPLPARKMNAKTSFITCENASYLLHFIEQRKEQSKTTIKEAYQSFGFSESAYRKIRRLSKNNRLQNAKELAALIKKINDLDVVIEKIENTEGAFTIEQLIVKLKK